MGLLALIVLFDFALFICACYACRGCYVDPCVEGSALQDIWRINDGLGFQLVSTSLVVMVHAGHCILLLNKGLNYSSFGYMTGSVLVFIVLMLGTAAHWTTLSTEVMGDLKDEGTVYVESGRDSKMNGDLKSAVEAIATFSFFLTILYTAVLSTLQLWESDLLCDMPEASVTGADHSNVAAGGSTYQSDYKMDGFPAAVHNTPGGIPPAVGTAGPAPMVGGYQNSFAPAASSNTDFHSKEPARL